MWRTPARRLTATSFVVAVVVALVLTSIGFVVLSSRPDLDTPAPDAASRSASPGVPPDAATAASSTFEVLGYTDGFLGRERRGYAFVIRSGAGTSFLLTDYDLLVDDFMRGARNVDLRRGDQTFSAAIIAVNPDPHVALLRIRGVYPALTLSPTRPRPGVTVTVGEPSATSARPAAVLGYSGPGGDKHLTFSVDISNNEDGTPILNSAQHVVGIAEPTSPHGTHGVGFAVPIGSACQAVAC